MAPERVILVEIQCDLESSRCRRLQHGHVRGVGARTDHRRRLYSQAHRTSGRPQKKQSLSVALQGEHRLLLDDRELEPGLDRPRLNYFMVAHAELKHGGFEL